MKGIIKSQDRSSPFATVKKAFIVKPDEPIRLTAEHVPGDRFVVLALASNGQTIPAVILTLTEKRELIDKYGTVYAAEDETLMVDTTDRTGVGVFSLEQGHWSEGATDIHDFQTSCVTYQETYSRSETEDQLARNLDTLADTASKKATGKILSRISRTLSWLFWDVPRTRWK